METKYIAIFFLIILTFNRFRLSKRTATLKEKDTGEIFHRWTYAILFLLYIIVFLGSIFENYFFVPRLNIIFFFVGFVAYWTALIGRNKAIRTLGRYWSTHIEIREKHCMVQDGPYKYIRHPGYMCLFIETLSLPVMLNAYYSLLGVICIYLPVMFMIAKLEDKEMEKKIGKNFLAYKEKTRAFIPKNLFDFIIPSFKKKHQLRTNK
jgi:protein-S-isoprenylcysteine O-methyltransferase Ste14